MISRVALIAAVALAVSATASSAAARAASSHKPDLAIQSVSTQQSAIAGAPFDVQLTVARTGRAGSATIGFYLSKRRVRDSATTRLAATARVPGGGAGARRTMVPIDVQPEIPSGQAPGRYFLVACIDASGRGAGRTRCRASSRPLTVTAVPVSTSGLLAAAVAAHNLTPQQAMVYRVFSAFGDPRLPSKYAGSTGVPSEDALGEVMANWSQLSPAQQALMRPFFTPPPVPGSWASKDAKPAAAGSAATASGAGPACVTGQLKDRSWRSIARPNGHVRLWWLASEEPVVGAAFRHLLPEIEDEMWPKLSALMGREPLPDGGEKCWHGIDSKLDIYVLPLTNHVRALTIPYAPRCTHAPAFIVFNESPPDRWEMAHELMHAFQFSFRYHAACSSYANWDESTATWAGQYLYPHDNVEHHFTWLLTDPTHPLNEADYDGWTFPYAMEQLHGAATIAAIYKQTERLDVLHAIDAGIPGGLRQAWADYARLAWNQDPVSPTFREWDDLTDVPQTGAGENRAPIEAVRLDPGASGHQRVEFPTDLAPLTRSYADIKFGPGVTEVSLENSNFHVPGINVQAVIEYRDGSTTTEDLTSTTSSVLCPQTPGQRPIEILLVVSNGSMTEHTVPGYSVAALASNVHCRQYTGTISGTASLRQGADSVDEAWSIDNITFNRLDLGESDNMAPRFVFDASGGTVRITISGTRGGCAISAAATVPLRANGGELDIWASADRGEVPSYSGVLDSLPIVPGTQVCRGVSTPTNFLPSMPIGMSAGRYTLPVSADGILRGAQTMTAPTLTRTLTWRLVPQG